MMPCSLSQEMVYNLYDRVMSCDLINLNQHNYMRGREHSHMLMLQKGKLLHVYVHSLHDVIL